LASVSSLNHQLVDPPFRQSLTRLAVAPRIGRAFRLPSGRPERQNTSHRLPTGLVGIEHLGKKSPEGHQGNKNRISRRSSTLAEKRMELLGWQEIGERQPRLLKQAPAQQTDLACNRSLRTI
jgi:hypothetical protein